MNIDKFAPFEFALSGYHVFMMQILCLDVIFSFESVMGSAEHPLSTLSIEGSVKADGESFDCTIRREKYNIMDIPDGGPGGGSGGTVLMFLRGLALGESALLSSIGGRGSPNGGGGGGGGRIHFHWSDIPTGDVYQPIASVEGIIDTGSVYAPFFSFLVLLTLSFSPSVRRRKINH